MVQKYLRPAAAKAGVLSSHLDEDGKLVKTILDVSGFTTFVTRLASSLCENEVDPRRFREFFATKM
jgi:hypothetical protein